jgi:hypothetical protein
MSADSDKHEELHKRAYAAIDSGDLLSASNDFESLLQMEPNDRFYHYMLGLARKYSLDWRASLAHNLRAIELDTEFGEAEHWNAAIAATALGDWAQARRLWATLGIKLPKGEGPIHDDFGVAVVRLNPWNGGETVFMRRIDPVRGRLLNVPLPASGHRFGDIVLHDGARTGSRHDGDQQVPVFNELARLVPSDFQTFVVFVSCKQPEDIQELLASNLPGIGYAEDWTETVRYYCMRCSYGTTHKHDFDDESGWQNDRNLGIAAQSRASVEKLLQVWKEAGHERTIDGVEANEQPIPGREDGHVWWREPDEE